MKWITKNGRVVDIEDMSTPHLENAIAMLKRSAPRLKEEAVFECGRAMMHLNGEMAQMEAEHEYDRLLAMDPITWLVERYPLCKAMIQELENRTIRLPNNT